MLTQIAVNRDLTTVYRRIVCYSPLTNIVTDWRDLKMISFAKLYEFRRP